MPVHLLVLIATTVYDPDSSINISKLYPCVFVLLSCHCHTLLFPESSPCVHVQHLHESMTPV